LGLCPVLCPIVEKERAFLAKHGHLDEQVCRLERNTFVLLFKDRSYPFVSGDSLL
jgi:hypothetical protein